MKTQFPQGLDRVLGGFGLHIAHRVLGDQGYVDKDIVVRGQLAPHLADSFEEGHALDVADRAADFYQADVSLCTVRELLFCRLPDAGFDLVGDMGDDLDRLAKEISLAFLLDDGTVHLAGGDVVGCRQLDVEETLVVAKVEIHLAPVL